MLSQAWIDGLFARRDRVRASVRKAEKARTVEDQQEAFVLVVDHVYNLIGYINSIKDMRSADHVE